MAYNNRNKLLTVEAVQKLVLAGKKRGATQKWVYENEVLGLYPMSYSTFNNYLSVNVTLERAKTEKKLADKRRTAERRQALQGCQLSIEFN